MPDACGKEIGLVDLTFCAEHVVASSSSWTLWGARLRRACPIMSRALQCPQHGQDEPFKGSPWIRHMINKDTMLAVSLGMTRAAK